jgi:hypothetical protein
MAENDHHPEKRQQRSGGENDKLDVEQQESKFSGERGAETKSLRGDQEQGKYQLQYFSCTSQTTDYIMVNVNANMSVRRSRRQIKP